MQAAIIDAYGPDSPVHVRDVPRPTPQAGEVLVKVVNAGVNPIDWKIRNGRGQQMGLALPLVLGGEVAGTVAAVGAGVTDLAVGDAVYGTTGTGAFAEYVVAQPRAIGPKPAGLDFVQAAALPLAALTAWQGLFDKGDLVAGQRLLITGASSVVGALAVQLAKQHGATVVAVASGANEDLVRGLGADEFVDYKKEDFARVARDIDVVFDTVGGDSFARAHAVPKQGGVLVTAVETPDEDKGRAAGIRVVRVTRQPNPEQLAAVSRLAEAGGLAVKIATVRPLAEAPQALALSEARHTTGKIVLAVA